MAHGGSEACAAAGARVLAASDATAVQALAIGDHAIGTQFHCEFTPADGGHLVIDPGLCWTAWNGIWDAGAYPRLVAESYPAHAAHGVHDAAHLRQPDGNDGPQEIAVSQPALRG